MTQEELVKIAIDILIHGEVSQIEISNNWIYWEKKLENKHLNLNLNSFFYFDGEDVKYYRILFDKNVKNMAMLSVLVKDWSNERNALNCYKNWIKRGTES